MILSIIYSSAYLPNSELHPNAIEFSIALDLTEENATILAIGSYMINEDREPEAPFLFVTAETLEKERISIELGALKNSADVINLRNQTRLNGPVRQFKALTLNMEGKKEQELHGWIDQRRNVYESFVIKWYRSRGFAPDNLWASSLVNTSTEGDYIIEATNMIVSRVGAQYFEEYFHDPVTGVSSYNPTTTIVTYQYDIKLGNYSYTSSVRFYFHPNYTRVWGIPIEGNLQPFTVTVEEAKKLAVKAGLPDSQYELEVYPICIRLEDGFFPSGKEEYVWNVVSWDDPPWAYSRIYHYATIDTKTGEVYRVGWGGRSLQLEEVDTREEALSQGIEGYVSLQYPELESRKTLTQKENYTFVFQISFTSYVEDLKKLNLTVLPDYVGQHRIQSNMGDKLREYLSYEPSGELALESGETVNVTCTLHVPPGQDGFTFPTHYLQGLGIGAENTLMVIDPGD